MAKWSRRTALAAAAGATAIPALPAVAAARPARGGGIYEISSGRHRVVVDGIAATLLSWQVDGAEVLLTHQPGELGEGYQGKTILPWPNRIENGQYTFGGEELQVPINEPSRSAALHGLMSFVEWSPVRHRQDGVALEYRLPPQYGYPFSLAFHIEYTVDRNGVSSRLTARNTGDTDAPFGTANHSYVAAARGTIDSIGFELPADTYYVTDDNLIPTGTEPVDGTDYDFRTARELGSTTMDTAFTGLSRGSDGNAVVRFERPGGADVELWVDRTHGYLQVYTDDSPSTDRPPRAGITVEPMTCAPNAFVTGDGLIRLRPGQVHEGAWGYRVAS
ncbi:aldose 1-epimerase family protein [Saccharopolyspora taberi]|uniref:Aldose 1-epimerase family protein n=1 Tax=Saccharopolyspora taberi TaxID=60895 RepID=A0ABN3V3G0_9PSEU